MPNTTPPKTGQKGHDTAHFFFPPHTHTNTNPTNNFTLARYRDANFLASQLSSFSSAMDNITDDWYHIQHVPTGGYLSGQNGGRVSVVKKVGEATRFTVVKHWILIHFSDPKAMASSDTDKTMAAMDKNKLYKPDNTVGQKWEFRNGQLSCGKTKVYLVCSTGGKCQLQGSEPGGEEWKFLLHGTSPSYPE